MFDDQNDKNVRKLLQSIEADTTRTSPEREKIRSSVLATFDDALAASTDAVPGVITLFDDATAASTEDQDEVITLTSVDGGTRRSTSPRRALSWAAAVAAMIVGAILLLPDGSGLLNTAAPTVAGGLSLDGTDLPAVLLPGPQSTDIIARGLSFETPEGLIVTAASEGQLILVLADDPDGSSGQLMFVELELSDWESQLRVLAEAGDVSLKEIGVMVDGRATTRLDVTISNEALAAGSCAVGEPCMSFEGTASADPAALWSGSDNRIVEIGRSVDSMVLAIEVSQQFQGPLSRLAAQVVSTASLSSD
jgi:hypothetical protein